MSTAEDVVHEHEAVAPVRAALRNRDLRRAIIAYLASVISEWALWAGLLIYAYERGGTAVAGFVGVGMFVPGALIAPMAGSAADGPRPHRSLGLVYLTQAVMLAVAAVFAYLNGPLLVVIVPTAIAITSLAYVRPCYAVVAPGLVTSARELTAANLLTGYCDSGSVLLGPLIAAGLIAIDGPRLVFAASAGLALIGVAATAPLARLEVAYDGPRPAADRTRTGALVDGVRELGRRSGALQLLTVIGGQYVVVGALDLLFVVLAAEQFDLSQSGPALLGAVYGAGAVVGGAAATVLVARKRLAPVLLVSMAATCSVLFAIAGFTNLTVTVIVLPLAGAGIAVLDLTGRMLMQRAAPQDALASVFATVEALSLIACAIGSIIAQVVIAVAGVRAAVLAIAVVLAAMLLSTATRLVQVDSSADAPVVTIRLLRRIPVFAPLPGPAMEGVARAATSSRVAAGTEIISEGESGDRYYAIVTGEVDVSEHGEHLGTMTRGQGFGEIALLADVERTATVTASTDVDLLVIERVPFLTAVTGHDASNQAAWAVARSLRPAIEPDGSSDDTAD